jgi:hypothetical protein
MSRSSLGGEDAAWLHMDDATNPMVVNGLVELAGRIEMSTVIRLLNELVQKSSAFGSRVIDSRTRLGTPHWKLDDAFDVAQNVDHVELEAAGDDASLRSFVCSVVSKPLDMTRPAWRVYVIDRPGFGTTLLLRVHHAIGDGFALLTVLESLCDEASVPTAPPAAVSHEHSARAYAAGLERLVALPPDSPTVLKGELSHDKRVAWTEAIALEDVKSLAQATSATVNDLLVATIAGALRRYLARRGEDVRGLEVRAMVPVNLRDDAASKTLGNNFGLVVLELPIGVPDPLLRVAVVKQSMRDLKNSPEAEIAHTILGAMGHVPRQVESLGVSFFSHKASLVLTNVRGPRSPLHLAGVRIARLMFWVPQSARLGLGVSIFSYAGEITIGVIADAALIADPDTLAADVHVELAALQAELRSHERAKAEDGSASRSV